jgi:hypothetical protein
VIKINELQSDKDKKISYPQPKNKTPNIEVGSKKRFNQLLDDAVLGIKKK